MIQFFKHSGIYTLEASQELNIPLVEAWDYFSSPNNLSKITPARMGFNITSKVDRKAYQGQIITYKVSPIPFVNTNWVTEITTVKEQEFFIDEQRFGPYSMWHHEHFFESLPNGNTLMKDKISYKLPFGFLGDFAHQLFVKKQLKSIFEYREEVLDDIFK
jgi:ligand-binding SRPBCC domain-containing protein